MKNWFTSLKGAVTLSVISLLVFLGRTFIDFYYVYAEFSLSVGMVGLTMLVNMALFGGWIWGLLSTVQGSRRGLISVLVFDLFFLLVIAVGTLVSYCPSPCQTAWPLAEVTIWASLVFGLLAAISTGFHLREASSE
ncbi:MAG: hypothetical protein ACE5GO_07145 [Anaerolineales bacterium]